MKRGQIFIRAQDETGNWGSADVMDLTEESFRAWLCEFLIKAEAVHSLRPEYAEGEPIRLVTKPGVILL